MSRLRCFALALAILVPAVVRSADSGALAGKWVVQAETPQGPMELGFDMKLEGGRLVGTVATFGTVVPMNELKFDDPQLTMQITVMDSDYKLNGTLKEGKMSGTWEQVGGDMKGTWTATKAAESAPAAAASQASVGIDGTWNCVASTPEGERQFALEIKSSGSSLEGKILDGGTGIQLSKGAFANGQVSFEFEYEGDMYRIEATLAGDKLTGKWSAVDGSNTGAFSAERGKP